MHSFSLSMGHLLEQIQTCSAHKDGRATTEGMELEANSRSGGEEIQPVGEKDEEETCGSGERTKQGRERFSLFKPWERAGCKPNQECSLNRSQMAAGRVLTSCPQLSQTGEKEQQERGGGCAGYASNRRKNADGGK